MRKKLHFEIVSRYVKNEEPTTTGVPFAKGELRVNQLSNLQICDETKAVEAQFKPTAFWDDGSIKWLLVHFLANLPANSEKTYFLTDQHQFCHNVEKNSFILAKTIDSIEVNTGSLKAVLSQSGQNSLFEQLTSNGCVLLKNHMQGPIICDTKGNSYCIEIGENSWEIIENGCVFAMVRATGRHKGTSGYWLDFSVILKFWKNKPWFYLDYQFINTQPNQNPTNKITMDLNNEQAGLKYDKNYHYEEISSITLNIKLNTNKEKINHSIYTSSFNFHAKKAYGDETIKEIVTADTIVETPNEMFPEVLFSIFTADVKTEDFGIAAGIYQAFQNFTKALQSNGEGIVLSLLPKTEKPLKVPQGVARTSRCYVYFHKPNLDDRMLIDRAHQFEMPPIATLSPQTYIDAGVFGKYVDDKYHFETERFLYRYVDSRAKGLGMLNFGDGPEWEYIKQGRSKGEIIWINNECDMPHNFMVMLARTGDRRYFDYMKAAVEHWYDVDLCHFSEQPYREGLLYTHSVDHISGQPVPSHQWVEGFLDYYHLTGNPNGLYAAMSIGKNLLKMMQLPIYSTTATVEPREIGWAMRTFMALYKETYDEKWLKACKPIVNTYLRWAQELGTWTTPYPDNYLDRVPFMMHVGIVGLYQYYEVCPTAEVKQTILQVVDDIVANCYIKHADMFFCKQYPAVRFLNLNGMVLESLAIAYELTGNSDYIKKGRGMFSWITVENPPPIYDFLNISKTSILLFTIAPLAQNVAHKHYCLYCIIIVISMS